MYVSFLAGVSIIPNILQQTDITLYRRRTKRRKVRPFGAAACVYILVENDRKDELSWKTGLLESAHVYLCTTWYPTCDIYLKILHHSVLLRLCEKSGIVDIHSPRE